MARQGEIDGGDEEIGFGAETVGSAIISGPFDDLGLKNYLDELKRAEGDAPAPVKERRGA